MHVIFRESHGLDETETPIDLCQTPADIIVLSFSDSDLGAFAAGWHLGKSELPTTRLANLVSLRHPLSIDTYAQRTLSSSRAILIRLIGGMSYWPYGLQQTRALAEEHGIALAVLPADGREDTQLDEISTLPVSTLRHLAMLCDTGGAEATKAALGQLALAAGLYAKPTLVSKTIPRFGSWKTESGVSHPDSIVLRSEKKPLVIMCFYLSFLTSADLDPLEKLSECLNNNGFEAIGLFAPSLKDTDASKWITEQIRLLKPAAIVNATAFSGIGPNGLSPLDVGGVPVFQMALATSTRKNWVKAERGLSPADLVMHVVLPEVDGRLNGGIGSFKQPSKRDQDLEYSRFTHQADIGRMKALVDRLTAHVNLQSKKAKERVIALVLSTYPGKAWNMAHAVGLDALASAEAILEDIKEQGYHIENITLLAKRLQNQRIHWDISDYEKELGSLSKELRKCLNDAWGAPKEDKLAKNGSFAFRAVQCGSAVVALQPERGLICTRDADYHDTNRIPCHSYVAFYLWLRRSLAADALIHIGAHGTLEWLPGKSVALSESCWPEVLIGDMPVIYPFIVNDPGEAAQAKRRIGAITLGHIPPALKQSITPDKLTRLENLLDEFSNAGGLDPKRRDRLQDDIRAEAQSVGVEHDLGLNCATTTLEAIARIDRFVCDIKESQFGDGLHIFGRTPNTVPEFDAKTAAQSEKKGIIKALSGIRVSAGPSGSPYRGRSDVLPTGRNLFTTDPRSVPTRSAYAQGVRLAEELVRRHLQENGEYPKNLIIDLWGSATMRTAGEEFAMGLHLMGVKPKWDKGSERVNGVEIIPISELERPRLDVALRVSGLFRDVFPTLTAIFSQAVEALSNRDESLDWNPFVTQSSLARVFGPKPGSYGLALGSLPEKFTKEAREEAGEAWLEGSSYSFNGDHVAYEPEAIANIVQKADSFVHLQDLRETDLLLAADYANHVAGFSAAQSVTGGNAALYHLDNTLQQTPKARSLREEIARVVQARASNSDWIAGMGRHGFRGAAEIAATLDHMAAFAQLADVVGSHLFDSFYEATFGDDYVRKFLQQNNSEAYEAMKNRFQELQAAGIWVSRRNSIVTVLDGTL
ncbi:MAG: cobaltochelatase subunit CobN [Rhodobacteraceae bacterium]|nr:cobaltochelatase subunit CobN [Paracoccaceae bacterium]